MKKLLLILTLCCACAALFAQDEQSSSGFNKNKVFFGGNFGLSFGSYTFINVSPQVGYRFNKYFASGVGLNLLYVSDRERDLYGNDYRKTVQGVTGLNVFGRVYPVQRILLQVQPEANYRWGKQIYYQPTEESYKLDAEIVPSLLVGGGLVIPAGNGGLLVTLMYDVLEKPYSPYGNRPVFNIGYNFSL